MLDSLQHNLSAILALLAFGPCIGVSQRVKPGPWSNAIRVMLLAGHVQPFVSFIYTAHGNVRPTKWDLRRFLCGGAARRCVVRGCVSATRARARCQPVTEHLLVWSSTSPGGKSWPRRRGVRSSARVSSTCLATSRRLRRRRRRRRRRPALSCTQIM